MIETKCTFMTVPDQYPAIALTIVLCYRHISANFSKIFRSSVFSDYLQNTDSAGDNFSSNVLSSMREKIKFSFNPFVPNAPFFDLLKTLENSKVF